MNVTWNDSALQNPPVASEDAVRDAEQELGIRFPTDFLEVARHHQGAQPEPGSFDVPDFGGTAIDHLLHFEDSPGHSNIVSRRFPVEDGMEDGIIPFAEDIGGDLLCFDYRGNPDQPTIVFWSVDTGPVPVADSFTEFLSRLR